MRLEGRDYEFEIAPSGDQITLKPLPKNIPDDQILRAGYPAPDFAFRDLQGNSRKLSDFRGKLLLLDFWFINCGPCQQAIPKLVAAYGKFHARGFEIIGINGEDKAEALRPFLAQKKMPWPQVVEDFEGPIHTKYRINSAPTYYLVGPDGKIIARRLGADDFLADLEKLSAKLK